MSFNILDCKSTAELKAALAEYQRIGAASVFSQEIQRAIDMRCVNCDQPEDRHGDPNNAEFNKRCRYSFAYYDPPHCRHCTGYRRDHAPDGKCLFEATHFEAV